ncbi:hypothetical protein H0H81_006751 [Sphagnurus paluster]|uniref:Uncharacterized protein n=1 Tax=Sphagnurus paluster TaxID=117069 RepID=A0A9P7GJV8_9AGAR|nr:hypothetical protein H0H81_006751 [Sphagnurus paluster]
MSSPSNPAALQPNHIRNLILILRRANAHYTYVASRIRASLKPTQHARTRAQNLGLRVNIEKAHNCPQKQVSVVPLPIIEVSPPPIALAPIPYQSSRSVDMAIDNHEPKRRPALKCAIPPAVLTRTSPNGTTSALSSGQFSAVSLSSAISVRKPPTIRYSSRWFATEDEGYPRNAVEAGASLVLAAPAMQQAQLETKWAPLDVPIDEDAMDWGLELQYPEDVCDSMDISPTNSASSSGSGSASGSTPASSAGPATPRCGEPSPLMIRIKRKSMEVRNDNDSFEKRPRVFYKEEVTQSRRNVIRIPARR